jgi:hypothetical protein
MFLGFSFDFFFIIISDGISSIARNTLTYHTNSDHAEYKIGSACVTYRTEDEYVLDFSENTWKESDSSEVLDVAERIILKRILGKYEEIGWSSAD